VLVNKASTLEEVQTALRVLRDHHRLRWMHQQHLQHGPLLATDIMKVIDCSYDMAQRIPRRQLCPSFW